MRLRPIGLACLVLTAACGRGPRAAPPDSEPVTVASPPTVTPSASDRPTAPSAGPPAASADPPCPAEHPRRIREGTAILNADPAQLPGTPPAPGAAAVARPRLSFDQARAAAGVERGDFTIWLEDETWHLRANGKKAKPGTLYQARVERIRDVELENQNDRMILYSRPRLSPGRCWNDPPVPDPALARTGFDWPSTAASIGIRFKAPASGCFLVQLRVGEKEALPSVVVGSLPVPSNGALADTIELCR